MSKFHKIFINRGFIWAMTKTNGIAKPYIPLFLPFTQRSVKSSVIGLSHH